MRKKGLNSGRGNFSQKQHYHSSKNNIRYLKNTARKQYTWHKKKRPDTFLVELYQSPSFFSWFKSLSFSQKSLCILFLILLCLFGIELAFSFFRKEVNQLEKLKCINRKNRLDIEKNLFKYVQQDIASDDPYFSSFASETEIEYDARLSGMGMAIYQDHLDLRKQFISTPSGTFKQCSKIDYKPGKFLVKYSENGIANHKKVSSHEFAHIKTRKANAQRLQAKLDHHYHCLDRNVLIDLNLLNLDYIFETPQELNYISQAFSQDLENIKKLKKLHLRKILTQMKFKPILYQLDIDDVIDLKSNQAAQMTVMEGKSSHFNPKDGFAIDSQYKAFGCKLKKDRLFCYSSFTNIEDAFWDEIQYLINLFNYIEQSTTSKSNVDPLYMNTAIEHCARSARLFEINLSPNELSRCIRRTLSGEWAARVIQLCKGVRETLLPNTIKYIEYFWQISA